MSSKFTGKVFRTISIAVVGHVDHGKTTLSSAITKVVNKKFELSDSLDYNQIKKTNDERIKGVTIVSSTNEMLVKDPSGNVIRIIITDCPGHKDYIKNLVAGTANIDNAVLTVSAAKGCEPQTLAHLELIRPVYLSKPASERVLFVMITQTDQVGFDEDMINLIKSDIEGTLNSYIEDGTFSEVKIFACCAAMVTGVVESTEDEYNAQFNNIVELVDGIVAAPAPTREENKPFRMEIEKVRAVVGIGSVLVGTIKFGKVKVSDELELYFTNNTRKKVIVTSIETFNKKLDVASAGESIGLVVRGDFKKEDVERGCVLAAPSSLTVSKGFIGMSYVHEAPGKRGTIQSGSEQCIVLGTNKYTCTIVFLTGLEEADKGKAIDLIKKGAKLRHSTDANSLELQKIIQKSGFTGAKDDESHEVIVTLCNDKSRVPFEVGGQVVGQESNTNRISIKIYEVF